MKYEIKNLTNSSTFIYLTAADLQSIYYPNFTKFRSSTFFKLASLYVMALLAPFVLCTTVKAADTNDIFGVWGSVTLQGDLSPISSDLNRYKWIVMNQTRTKDDSIKGSRESENLLFAQIGYQATDTMSFWLGYVHDWILPLNKKTFEENRPYLDFLWTPKMGDLHFMARSRMEARIHQSNDETGYRYRQLMQVNYPIANVEGLSAYLGDEIFFYLNQNNFGKLGFTENRVFSGLSYQFTEHFGTDLGYMGQYVDTISGNNLFTHNLQVNFRYKF